MADTLETALNGLEATDVYEGERVTAVVVRLGEEHRRDEDAVRNLLQAPGGQRIALSELAEIGTGEGPQTIFRENLMHRKIDTAGQTGPWQRASGLRCAQGWPVCSLRLLRSPCPPIKNPMDYGSYGYVGRGLVDQTEWRRLACPSRPVGN